MSRKCCTSVQLEKLIYSACISSCKIQSDSLGTSINDTFRWEWDILLTSAQFMRGNMKSSDKIRKFQATTFECFHSSPHKLCLNQRNFSNPSECNINGAAMYFLNFRRGEYPLPMYNTHQSKAAPSMWLSATILFALWTLSWTIHYKIHEVDTLEMRLKHRP